MISALVGHLVGDYLLQNDYLAQGKKQSHLTCIAHCIIWTLCVTLFAGWWVWWIPPVLFATHFIQDRWGLVGWYMRVMGQSKFASPPMAPWSMIVVDNTLHILCLWVVWKIIG